MAATTPTAANVDDASQARRSLAIQRENEYQPDHVSMPGETLEEILVLRGLTPADLAGRTGLPQNTIHEIIEGEAGIAPETAMKLELALGVSAVFWLNLERSFRGRGNDLLLR